ncbi:MAG: hypothetical protein JOZ77_13215 [Candidatus Eremiobacteraeota bacterium]|nr:hypothetical protein [Candidatus Eremiobacteraeota bacterium]
MRSIVAAIARAAGRWSDPTFLPRVHARESVSARTGYSLATVEYAFDRLFGNVRAEAIEAVIADELGCLEILDDFVGRRGRPRARALPIGRVCIISSRTTIGVAIVPAIFAICAKCDVFVKDREDYLVAAFLQTLTEELPELAGRALAQPWVGGAGAVNLRPFDTIVAFGSDATLAEISAQVCFPSRLIGFGSKASAGYIASAALRDEREACAIAALAARDLVLYESEGCLSLHALFLENPSNVSAARFAEILIDAMRAAALTFPPALDDPATASRRAIARELATFRGNVTIAQADTRGDYLAVVDPPFDEPPLFLPRTTAVRSVDSPAAAARYLEHHNIELESIAVTSSSAAVFELAARTKAARITAFGTLQAPALGDHSGGRPRIAEFVRWLVDES